MCAPFQLNNSLSWIICNVKVSYCNTQYRKYRTLNCDTVTETEWRENSDLLAMHTFVQNCSSLVRYCRLLQSDIDASRLQYRYCSLSHASNNNNNRWIKSVDWHETQTKFVHGSHAPRCMCSKIYSLKVGAWHLLMINETCLAF